MLKVLGVIPSRYAAVRFPGKPLAILGGKPMVRWVYEAARRALPRVVVATDDERIADAVAKFGGEVVMTPATCASGTDRMACVARKISAAYYVNVQGDEPMMATQTVRSTLKVAMARRAIGTAATFLEDRDRDNPNAVKVVLDKGGRALYFSRSMLPFEREQVKGFRYLKHLGIYAYPRKDLFRFVSLPPAALERIEKLEQLRALYNGLPIFVAVGRHDSVGVDTPADLKAVERRLKAAGKISI